MVFCAPVTGDVDVVDGSLVDLNRNRPRLFGEIDVFNLSQDVPMTMIKVKDGFNVLPPRIVIRGNTWNRSGSLSANSTASGIDPSSLNIALWRPPCIPMYRNADLPDLNEVWEQDVPSDTSG